MNVYYPKLARFTLCIFCVVVILFNTSRLLHAETAIFDDFNDRSVINEMPVNWDGNPVVWTPRGDPGFFDASSGDYVLTHVPGSPEFLVSDVLDVILEETSTRIHVRLSSTGGSAGVAIRNQDRINTQHYFGGIGYFPNNGGTILFLGLRDRSQLEFFGGLPVLPFDVRSEDAMLQLDMFGNELKLWGWRAGDPMPDQPQLVAQDNRHTSGFVRIFSGSSPSNDNISTFRYVHVADHKIIDGDATDDGRIDIDDLNAVRNNFGAGDGSDLTGILGDTLPYDGLVNIDDLNNVRNNFGSMAAVPEPGGWLLMLMALAVVGQLRRGR